MSRFLIAMQWYSHGRMGGGPGVKGRVWFLAFLAYSCPSSLHPTSPVSCCGGCRCPVLSFPGQGPWRQGRRKALSRHSLATTSPSNRAKTLLEYLSSHEKNQAFEACDKDSVCLILDLLHRCLISRGKDGNAKWVTQLVSTFSIPSQVLCCNGNVLITTFTFQH